MSKKLTLIPLVVMAIIGLTFATVKTVQAFSNTFPDAADSSGSSTVYLVNGESQFVRETDSDLRVWFPTSSGSVTISNGNFCTTNPIDTTQSGDVYANVNSIPTGSAITNFTVGTQTVVGKKYTGGSASCNNTYTINLSGLTAIENGYYYADINVRYAGLPGGPYDGVLNAYRLTSSGSSYIGLRTSGSPTSGGTGHDASQVQNGSGQTYKNYHAPFGTRCSNVANETATLGFYDLDNAGGAGAQVGRDITIRLYDLTAGAYVDFSGVPSSDLSNSDTTWTPRSIDNSKQSINFTAQPSHKYRLDINDVYYNNNIQYSLPYTQINRLACKAPVACNAGAVAVPSSFSPMTPGATGVQVTFSYPKGGSALVYTIGRNAAEAAYFGRAWPSNTVAISSASTSTTVTMNVSLGTPAGSYPVSYTITGETGTCPPGSLSVFNLPFVDVTGASVSAGGQFKSFDSTCVGDPAKTGILGGWYNNSSGAHYGSSTDLSTLALVKIVGFASSQTTKPGTGLTFSNDTDTANGGLPAADFTADLKSPSLGGDLNYGGGSTQHCLTEYDAPAGAANLALSDTTINNLPVVKTGAAGTFSFKRTGDLSINGTVRTGQNVGIYVTGDLYISDNITYDTSGWTITNLPSLVVVVDGNIYIDSAARRLDGLYVARGDPGDGSKGQIYTCASDIRQLIGTADLYSECNTQLLVNGSFVANQINLLRTYGTLRDGAAASPGSCANSGGAPPVANTCAAEIFQFSPELYLSNPAIPQTGGKQYRYNTITNLPPVL